MRKEIRDRYYRVFTYQDVDRVPDIEFGYWPQTIRRWLAEGMPLELEDREKNTMFSARVNEFLGFEYEGFGISLRNDMNPPFEATEGTADSFAIFADGWKLIWNVVVRDDRPELELFDHRTDPLDLVNIAGQNPEVVADLRLQLEEWRKMTEAAKVTPDGEGADVSPEELEQLRALGYAN